MRNKIITSTFVVLATLAIPLASAASSSDLPSKKDGSAAERFAASDSCSLSGLGDYFAIRISGVSRGGYVYINKMQYKFELNPTGGKSQFRLRIPNYKIIPARYTRDISWWGDHRRDNWWNQKKWTTFWKRSYKQGKISLRGAVWSGKFRADYSSGLDPDCSFKIKL